MRRCRPWAGLWLLAGIAAVPASYAQAPATEAAARSFLRKVIGLDDAELAKMEKGEVVTKQLPSPEKPEIAAFGVVKVKGTIEMLRERMRDFQSFR